MDNKEGLIKYNEFLLKINSIKIKFSVIMLLVNAIGIGITVGMIWPLAFVFLSVMEIIFIVKLFYLLIERKYYLSVKNSFETD